MNRTRTISLLLLVAMVGAWMAWSRYHMVSPASSKPDETKSAVIVAAEQAVDRPPLRFGVVELPFRYDRGDSGAAWPVEPVGGGVGIGDFDGDGRLDLFFAQGVPLPVGSDSNAESDGLLRNLGELQFENTSRSAGLECKGYGMGVAIADYDDDGFPDSYVTRYGPNTLWHNQGDGTFRDATHLSGVGCELWSLGVAFADFDDDGDLDMFVANYFSFDPKLLPFARDPVTGKADYGLPASFEGQPDVLYMNDGDGRFSDITSRAGITESARGMGVLAADFDQDGRIDILVANDAQENALWHNRGSGSFEEVGLASGVAVNAEGQAEANMGIAYGDCNADGIPDILISHLVGEHHTLWQGRNNAAGEIFFQDTTATAGLTLDSRPLTGWGTTFVDFDHDGWLDFVVVNGHIRAEPFQTYIFENPPILWRNLGAGRFANVTAGAGHYFSSLHQARGLAAGDLDQDEDLDLVVVHHNAPSVILRNDSPDAGTAVLLRLVGTSSNRDAIGSRITARVGDRRLVRTVHGGGGYMSADDRTVHFGLGTHTSSDEIEVRWPSGHIQSCKNVLPKGTLRLREDDLDIALRD